MLNPIDEIKARLGTYPAVQYVTSTDTLRMEAPQPGGFAIYMRRDSGDGWEVSFGATLHCRFDEAAAAAEFFAFGLSDQCRLRELHRGRVVYRAFAERRTDSGWRMVQETGLLLFPFWRRSREHVFQNTLLTAEDPT